VLSAVRRRLTLRGRRQVDAGITLMELMVTMSLMSVIGAMSVAFFVGSNRATSATADSSTTTANARTVMSSITQLIALADSPTTQAGYATGRFETITSSTLTFYSNTDANRGGSAARTAPTKVTLLATGTNLTEKLYAPITSYPTDYTTNYSSTPASIRVLLTNLGGTNLFTYCSAVLDASGNCVAATVGTAVASVAVTFVLTGKPGQSSQTLTSTVSITGALS
jgi:type II secretory pathway component PulJ